MSNPTKIHQVAGGEIELWSVPGSSVMLKINSGNTDPIELGEGEIEELISVLAQLAQDVAGSAEPEAE